MSPEMNARIALWRQKVNDGTIEPGEMKLAIAALREDRKSAVASSATARRAVAKAAIPDADALLNELDNI